jgi:hypothetical protein
MRAVAAFGALGTVMHRSEKVRLLNRKRILGLGDRASAPAPRRSSAKRIEWFATRIKATMSTVSTARLPAQLWQSEILT